MTLELKISPDRTIQIEAFTFDLDESIVFTDNMWGDITCENLNDLGFTVTPEQRAEFSGHGNLFAHCQKIWGFGGTKQGFNERMWKIFYRDPDRQFLPMPGAVETIKALTARDLPLALVTTNRTDYAELVLDKLGLLGDFPIIVGGDQVLESQRKPAPDIYWEAFRKLEVASKRVAGVEDSLHGVGSLKDSGAFCIAVPNATQSGKDFSQADLKLPNLLEFAKLIKAAA